MTKKQSQRVKALIVNGAPRYARCYDNGEPGERYTVVYSGRYHKKGEPRSFEFVGMSAAPFAPGGVGQHGSSQIAPIDAPGGKWPPAIGRKCHLGKRIPFSELPIDCKRLVITDYCDLWGFNTEQAGIAFDLLAPRTDLELTR